MSAHDDELYQHLDSLLSEPREVAFERGRTRVDALCGDRPLVLHGCGQIGRNLARVLSSSYRAPVAFSDNNRALWDSLVEGIPVFAPDEAVRRFGDTAAFVVSIWSPGSGYLAVEKQLTDLGAEIVVPIPLFFWAFPEALLPHYLFQGPEYFIDHAEEIRRAYRLLGDDASRDHYVGQVEWRLTMNYRALPPALEGNQYFPSDVIALTTSEVFVDCGAFDGDTIGAFVNASGGLFEHVYAFEPDPTSFAALQAFVEAMPASTMARISTLNAAVGSGEGCLRFDSSGATSSRVSDDGQIEVPCVRLDDEIPAATYIKLDIEGAEADALRGAADLIRGSRPKLAVSLYHKPEDIFDLPLLVESLGDGYRFACLSHMPDGLEFVLYALPE